MTDGHERFSRDRDDQPRYGERIAAKPAPRYGEYAPPGWVSPVPPATEPGDGGESDATGSADRPRDPRAQALKAANDRRPDSTRGYDAPPPQGSPVPGPPPAAVRRGSFNRFATFALLFLGLYNVVRTALDSRTFASMYVAEFQRLGYLSGDFASLDRLNSVGIGSAFAGVVVFFLVAVWSIRRLRAGKLSWLHPLVAGIVYNLVVGIIVVGVVMSDPAFVGMSSR